MADLFQVSQSKVKRWRQCRYSYHLRYVEHLKKKIKARPLQFGSIVHEMLEADANNECPFEKLAEIEANQGPMFAAERELYGELIDDVRLIMEAYFDYWAKQALVYVKYNGQRAEHWIEIDLCDGIKLVLKVDGFVRTKNKLRWMLENKTGKNIQNVDEDWRNLQSAVYFRACEIIGAPQLTGMLWNYVKSKPPTVPQILKSGGLSTRKIVTLPSVVRRVIRDNDLKEEDYSALIEQAEGSMGEYFQRRFTPLQPAVVDSVFGDFVATSQEMADRHGKSCEKNIGKHCGWCDYELICRTELTGGDVDFVKEREYHDTSKEKKSKKEPRITGGRKSTCRAGK